MTVSAHEPRFVVASAGTTSALPALNISCRACRHAQGLTIVTNRGLPRTRAAQSQRRPRQRVFTRCTHGGAHSALRALHHWESARAFSARREVARHWLTATSGSPGHVADASLGRHPRWSNACIESLLLSLPCTDVTRPTTALMPWVAFNGALP